mmetsp:Transcript_1437/g.4703  ORF Transcript_1437/g.4703 Transcript_1437/m.4703 type:complete len:160 (+) Transcript_1437:941-1420(+)
MMIARNWRACPLCQENIQRPRRLEAPTPQPQPQSPVVQSVVRGWPVRRDETRVTAVLPPLHQVAHVHFSFFYCPLIFAALGVLEPAEQAQWAELIDGPLVNGHPDFVGGQNTTFEGLLRQVAWCCTSSSRSSSGRTASRSRCRRTGCSPLPTRTRSSRR